MIKRSESRTERLDMELHEVEPNSTDPTDLDAAAVPARCPDCGSKDLKNCEQGSDVGELLAVLRLR